MAWAHWRASSERGHQKALALMMLGWVCLTVMKDGADYREVSRQGEWQPKLACDEVPTEAKIGL
jgi:hypothetical protein